MKQKQKIALLLCGCGVFDGSEIYEAVLTMLAISEAGCEYQCFAPSITHQQLIDHSNGDEIKENRNVFIESARLARGQIQPLAALKIEQFDALIVPGGFGVAKNITDFAFTDREYNVDSDIHNIIKTFYLQQKAIGLICIAPILAKGVFPLNTKYTIGNDTNLVNRLSFMGMAHQNCSVEDVVIDTQAKLVTTPAYMLANNISETAKGVTKLVKSVIALSE